MKTVFGKNYITVHRFEKGTRDYTTQTRTSIVDKTQRSFRPSPVAFGAKVVLRVSEYMGYANISSGGTCRTCVRAVFGMSSTHQVDKVAGFAQALPTNGTFEILVRVLFH